MTDKRNLSDERRDLAAEYALGVLEGDELQEARELARSSREFREEVARCSGRMAPLLEEIDPVTPPATSWRRIEARIGPNSANDNVVALKRRVGLWQGVAATATALAASLAIVLINQPPQTTIVHQPRPAEVAPMVATLGDQKQTMLVASWDPGKRQLVLAVASDMPPDPEHSHEVWVIPSGGAPRSLGVMPDRKQMHMRLADALAQLMREGATVAISVEPRGGSPTGSPTGPVVASGALRSA